MPKKDGLIGVIVSHPLCRLSWIWILVLLLPACGQEQATPAVVAQAPTVTPVATAMAAPASTPLPSPTPPPTSTPLPSATATATGTATASPTPTLTATPDPYAGLTIADLRSRAYGGGELQVQQQLAVTESFTRTLITYPSDGLTIYGFMNVPFGEGPFPVALVLHGYIPPEQYGTIAYTTRYADALARAGYLVIHPNYRNHPPSDQTEAYAEGQEERDFRVGYAVDVLNLLALVQQQAGQQGPLAQADAEATAFAGT